MIHRIDKIDGIGPVFRSKLESVGIATTHALLEKCGARGGRAEISRATGIREGLLLKWTNMADLMRLRGVTGSVSHLLEAAGVDSVAELKMRAPERLHARVAMVNDAKKLVKRAPALHDIASWVTAAQSMEPAVHH